MKIQKNIQNRIKLIFLAALVFYFLSLNFADAAADFAVNSFSCTPPEAVINDIFSCTAQIRNNGDAAGAVSVATLYPDTSNWLENSNYPQASGTSVSPGQTTEVTFTGLRAVKSGNNGFLKVMLDDVTDTYVADNNIKVNVIDVVVIVSNSVSSAVMSGTFDVTADVTAGGNIDIELTFTVNSGGCSIGSQSATKSITGMQDGNTQSRTWTVTQGTSGDCEYTVSAAATGTGGSAAKTDSSSSTVTCTNCPSGGGSPSSGGGGGGGGGGGTTSKIYVLGELTSAQAVELAKNEKAIFNISGIEHVLTLKELTYTEATITVESDAQTFVLAIGDEVNIDLNSDAIEEISVKLSSINTETNKSTFIITPLIKGEVSSGGGSVTGAAVGEEGPSLSPALSSFVWLGVVTGIIILVILILHFIRKRKFKHSSKKFGVFIILVLVITILLIFVSFKSSQKEITGKVVEKIDDRTSTAETEKSCRDFDNGKEYFVSGTVDYCENDKKCSSVKDSCSGKMLTEWYCDGDEKDSEMYECEFECDNGACVNLATEYKYRITRSGSGNGGGGGGGGGGTTTVTADTSQTYELGELDLEQNLEIVKEDNVVFELAGNTYVLTLNDNTPVQADFSIGAQTFSILVGEDKNVDLDNDGILDVYIKLKSINLITGKVELMIRKII